MGISPKLKFGTLRVASLGLTILATVWTVYGFLHAGISGKGYSPIFSIVQARERGVLIGRPSFSSENILEELGFSISEMWVHGGREPLFYGHLPFGLSFSIVRPRSKRYLIGAVTPPLEERFSRQAIFHIDGPPEITFALNGSNMRIVGDGSFLLKTLHDSTPSEAVLEVRYKDIRVVETIFFDDMSELGILVRRGIVVPD